MRGVHPGAPRRIRVDGARIWSFFRFGECERPGNPKVGMKGDSRKDLGGTCGDMEIWIQIKLDSELLTVYCMYSSGPGFSQAARLPCRSFAESESRHALSGEIDVWRPAPPQVLRSEWTCSAQPSLLEVGRCPAAASAPESTCRDCEKGLQSVLSSKLCPCTCLPLFQRNVKWFQRTATSSSGLPLTSEGK